MKFFKEVVFDQKLYRFLLFFRVNGNVINVFVKMYILIVVSNDKNTPHMQQKNIDKNNIGDMLKCANMRGCMKP